MNTEADLQFNWAHKTTMGLVPQAYYFSKT